MTIRKLPRQVDSSKLEFPRRSTARGSALTTAPQRLVRSDFVVAVEPFRSDLADLVERVEQGALP